jgi:hypothetical protein
MGYYATNFDLLCYTQLKKLKTHIFFKNINFELWSAVNFEHPGLVIVALAPGA